MRYIILLFLFPLILYSCIPILKNTVGRVIHTKSAKQFQFTSSDQMVIDYTVVNGIMVLQLTINEVNSLRFILDSGAATCLSENAAIRLGGILTAKSESSTDGNEIGNKAKIYFFENLRFNNFSFFNLEIRTFNDLPLKVDGILGSDFIANKIISMNSLTKKITFYTGQMENTTSKLFKIKKGWDGRYYTTIKIEKRKYNFLFDTGYSGSLFLKDTIMFNSEKKASYLSKSINMHSESLNILDIYDIPSIQMGGYTFENEYIRVNQEYGLKKDYGLLGISLFLNQNVVFDFNKKRIYFEKLNVNSNYNYFPQINFYINDGLRILNLQPEIFNTTEILPDDKVIEINKYKVPENEVDLIDFFQKKDYRIFEDSLELKILRADSTFSRKINWVYIK
jgi:hypothetical protein